MDDPVHQQYEAYPYPARDPGDEAKRLVTGSPSHLDEINHYLFAGARDFAAPFRALMAGGGTGDATIMLAQQLAERDGAGQVVYLDISRAAREIAEARAAARGLTNVTFVSGAIEQLDELGLGRFDYIDCCGVLHHLADPAAGLATLERVLDQRGGIGLMLYGALGRSGVYPAQQMLRSLGQGLALDQQIALARRLLAALPPTNWLARNPALGDHKRGDAELVDLLLHPRDRAYLVPEIVALADQAGFEPVRFIPTARYDPASYLKDRRLLDQLETRGPFERAAFAECLAGNLKTHVCYLVKRGQSAGRVARPDRAEIVPRLIGQDGATLAKAVSRDLVLRTTLDGLKFAFPLPRLAIALLPLIDGRRSLGELHEILAAREDGLDWSDFLDRFGELYRDLNGLNLLLLSQ